MVLLNGQRSAAPVSRKVIEKLAPSSVKVETELMMAQGSGFGASGAGALGCAYALNHHFGLGLTSNQVGEIAHVAEVICGTGLGDVIAQNAGGLVIRLSPGAPGTGKIDQIPVPSLKVDYVIRGPLSTEEILSNPQAMKEVNRAGGDALKELLLKPTFENFMNLSWGFALESNLARDWMKDAVEAVKSSGGLASMVMLGDAVFAFNGAEALSEFGQVGSAMISQEGARLE
ncbi:MAG: pantoate kinase [Methanotrichaceae archaeon]